MAGSREGSANLPGRLGRIRHGRGQIPRAAVQLIVRRSAIAGSVTCALVALQVVLAARQAVHPVTGRPIAQVMSHLGAGWLDRPEREGEEAPSKAIELLGLKPGSVVADVGAGSGYMSEKLSRAVGPSGRVYAVDIQPEMLALIDARAKKEGLGNIITVLGEPDDPKLPDGRVDLELMVDVYHELQHPQIVLRHLRRALRPDGRLVLLEYRKEDPTVPIREEHKMTVADAKAELEAEGFQLCRRQRGAAPAAPARLHADGCPRSMRSRTRCTSCPGVNGFCSSVMPGFSTPSPVRTLSV